LHVWLIWLSIVKGKARSSLIKGSMQRISLPKSQNQKLQNWLVSQLMEILPLIQFFLLWHIILTVQRRLRKYFVLYWFINLLKSRRS
jgi:hypothetical protein